jgi:hypothetical protein
MKSFALFCFLPVVLAVQPAAAQSWQEYTFSESGFAAQYPGKPTVSERPYRTAFGSEVKERVYAFNQGGVEYIVAVADLTPSRADKDKVIDEAAKALMDRGRLTIDYPGRIDWNYGREIVVVGMDGTSITDAIFFVDKKLYQIEVVYPEMNSDPVGSSGIGFFQTAFRFLH